MNVKWKRIIVVIIVLLLCLCSNSDNILIFKQGISIAQASVIQDKSFGDLKLNANSVLLMEQGSGKVLETKNANLRMFPASTTKMMTAIVALEHVNLSEKVKVGDEIRSIPKNASIAGLLQNEEYTMKELLTGLLLPSGNDAAYVIASYIGRKTLNQKNSSSKEAVKAFVTLMNKKATEIGCQDTHFSNPDGYHEVNHYTTANDLALIARKALENETFRNTVGLYYYQPQSKIQASVAPVIKSNKSDKKSVESLKPVLPIWTNTNLLLDKNNPKYYDPDVTGVKTGYTSQAGYCLVAAGTRNGLHLITVILHSTQVGRWNDTSTVLDYGFEKYQVFSLLKKGQFVTELSIENGTKGQQEKLNAISSLDFTAVLSKQQGERILKKIQWDEKLFKSTSQQQQVNGILSTIHKGQVLGKVTFFLDDRVLTSADLIAATAIQKKIELFPSIQNEAPSFFAKNWLMLLMIGTIVFFFLIGFMRRKKH